MSCKYPFASKLILKESNLGFGSVDGLNLIQEIVNHMYVQFPVTARNFSDN